MSRDIGRARDGMKAAPVTAPDAPGDAEPEPDIADRPLAPARSKMPAIPVDPGIAALSPPARPAACGMARQQDREPASPTPSPSSPTAGAALSNGVRLLLWIAPIAACAVAALAGWWLASAPAVRAGSELTEARQALQQEQDKAEKLGAALVAAWRELGAHAVASADKAATDQERDALQQALQQSEAAAAAFAQSLAQERDRNQQLEQQLAARPAPRRRRPPRLPTRQATGRRRRRPIPNCCA